VRSFGLVTPGFGWALDEGGLRVTADAGDTWKDATPPGVAASAVEAVFLLDPGHGWVATRQVLETPPRTELQVFRTSDGGGTWQSGLIVTGPGSGEPAFLDFVDPTHGFLVSVLESSSNFSFGELFATADGGTTWRRLDIPIGEPVRFSSPTDGWTAGGAAGDQLFPTRDGGASWQRMAVAAPARYRRALPAYGLPRLAGRDGVLPVTFSGSAAGLVFYRSSDGGPTWTVAKDIPLPADVLGRGVPAPVSIVSPLVWFALLPGPRIWSTRDGGGSDDLVSPNGLATDVTQIEFVSPSVGWATVQISSCPTRTSPKECQTRTAVVATPDAGQTWEELPVR
jgi:photosystem II stability/assembly factor-like uncharacterized protein